MSAETERDVIRAQAEKILGSGVLGRSRFYAALLEYLLACHERGHVPKEIEIAAEVFQRSDDFDPSQDSMVRVYAHNLRQKLQQYYADAGRDETDQITIPKGEYRLALAMPESDVPAPPPVATAARRSSAVPTVLAMGLSGVVGVMIGAFVMRADTDTGSAYQDVADSLLWTNLTDDDLPVTIVVGDYYIFGELDEFGNIARMVREFDINSRTDLDNRFMLDPDYAERHIDLELTYSATSTATALRSVMEVLVAAGKRTRVVQMSKLDTSIIREGHIVYLGYLSGLGELSEFAFAGSNLVIGDTPDELVDLTTGDLYISEAGLLSGQGRYRDYGLFSTMPGPAGSQLVFIAGTRDEGLMQAAEAVSNPDLVPDSVMAVVDADGERPDAFEILYEVAALDRTNLAATIVQAGPLATDRVAIGKLEP